MQQIGRRFNRYLTPTGMLDPGNPKAAAAVLTEDADWVSGSGTVLEGRKQIEEMHSQLLRGPAKGTRHSHPGTAKMRFIRQDVAIVDGDSYMGGFRDNHGNELPPEMSRYTPTRNPLPAVQCEHATNIRSQDFGNFDRPDHLTLSRRA